MSDNHSLQKSAARAVLHRLLKYIDKSPDENLEKLADKISVFFGNLFPPENFEKMKNVARDRDNVWHKFALSIISDIDRGVIEQMLVSLGIDAGYYGTKTVRSLREKEKCNIPFIILFDPTSACNLRCKGCWAAEYGHKSNLTNEEMQSIVSQGKQMGTHFYMLTGGEPLVRKDDIISLAENNKDCAFLIYTNATLIDRKFCEDINRAGNIAIAVSLEGSEESNDWRRGEGAYAKSVAAMDLLKANKCLFGVSVCYTRKNIDEVTSDSFMKFIIEKGAKFALYFNYMPIGQGGDKELIPTPAQREYMYGWLKKSRNSQTGNPIFVMDFQDDAEYVGGCIAGGRNYFHINSNGDIEPCVFIHFSDSNIKTHTLLEALKSPLFMQYYHNQPFNDNHLRPCPMLENPEYLEKLIKESGAHSSDLVHEETAEQLCAKCREFAAAWAPEAERIWNSTPHKDTHTQYYRDTDEAKAQCGGDCEKCTKAE